MVRHEDTGAMVQEPVNEAPRCLKLAGAVLSQQLLAVVRGLLRPPDVVQERKGRPR